MVTRDSPPPSFLLLFLGIGFFSQVSQILLIREFFVAFRGNEISFGFVFSSWLFWVAIGGITGKVIASKINDPHKTLTLLNLYLGVLLPLEIFVIRIASIFFNIAAGEELSTLSLGLFSFISLSLFCLPFGILFTLSSLIYSRCKEGEGGDAISLVYVLESLGSLVGGVLFTYLLVLIFNSFQIAFILSFLIVTLCLLSWRKMAEDDAPFLFHFLVVFLALTLGFFIISHKINQWIYEKHWRLVLPGYDLREVTDSKYSNIAILQRHGNDQYNIYINSELCDTTPNQYMAADIASLILVQHNDPKNILVIGSGITGLLNEIKRYPVESIHYVELDPVLIQQVVPYLQDEDRKVLKEIKIFYQDARHYIKTTDHRYDIIFLNLPNPVSVRINRFYTVEFFSEAKKILREKGVFITSLESVPQPHGIQLEVDISIYLSLAYVFNEVLFTPGERRYYLCSTEQGQISLDIDELKRRYQDRRVKSPYFLPDKFHLLLGTKGEIQGIKDLIQNTILGEETNTPDFMLDDKDRAEREKKLKEKLNHSSDLLNRDSHPITYLLNLMMANRKTKTDYREIFDGLKKVKESWFFLLCGVLFIISIIPDLFFRFKIKPLYERKAIGKLNLSFIVFTTGFFGMVVEILLLISFQNIYGYVYKSMGIMIASFMFGLSLGAFVNTKYIKFSPLLMLLGFQIAILCFLISISYFFELAGDISSETILPLFFILNTIAGFLDGGVFPLASKLHLPNNQHLASTAGTLYGSDLLGACLGALLGGTLMVPLFGIPRTCFMVAIMVLASIISLVLSCLWNLFFRKQDRGKSNVAPQY